MLESDKNMTILEEGDGRIRLRCHCGEEFSAKIKKNSKRPKCPKCNCIFADAEWELSRSLNIEEELPTRFFRVVLLQPSKETNTLFKQTIFGAHGRYINDVFARLIASEICDETNEIRIEECAREEYLTIMGDLIRKNREPSPMERLISGLLS